MDFSFQLPAASPSTASPVLVSSSSAAPVSSSAFVLPLPQPTNGGQALVNPNNTPLLQHQTTVTTIIVSLFHTHQVISLKLTNTNYLYWWMQIKSYLLSQRVFGFVDGLNSCPSPHVLTVDGASLKVNHSFLRWKQQDQLILNALLFSLSMKVLHLLLLTAKLRVLFSAHLSKL